MTSDARGTAATPANGYEMQIHNTFRDGDRSRPEDFGTGGIYRRIPARRIVGDDGAPCEHGPGELHIRGPSVFVGYHDRPDATREAFDAEGWFRTGDVATRDPEDGFVRLLGRTSVDILKTGGYKASALEIEEVLRELPSPA